MRTKKSEYDFMTEEEKKKSQYIDWNDFVVVETIDFNDEEIENENIDTNNNINNENINKNNEEEINEYNKNENEENENINKENQNQNIEKSNIQSEISVNGIKVIKNYVRQKQSDINDNNKDIKCPLCQIMISSMKFEEHIKLELLDPKWKEIQKDIAKRSKESPLANTSDFISYLSDFSHSRPDLFGNIQDVQKIREQRKKEEKQAQEHKIINENPYMTRTTANIMMFKIQNKTHLEESKKAQNMKNNDDNN
jgi:splicing factor 3A subunit 1